MQALLSLGALTGCPKGTSYVQLADKVVEKGPLHLDCDNKPTGLNGMLIHGLDGQPWAVTVRLGNDIDPDYLGVSENQKRGFTANKGGFKKGEEVNPGHYTVPGEESIVDSPMSMDVKITADSVKDEVKIICFAQHGVEQPHQNPVPRYEVTTLLRKRQVTSPSSAR